MKNSSSIEKKFKVNWYFLIAFISIVNLGGLQIGYILSSANQTAMTFNVIFGWKDKSQQALFQTLIGSSIVLGLALGAIGAGWIVGKGRLLSF